MQYRHYHITPLPQHTKRTTTACMCMCACVCVYIHSSVRRLPFRIALGAKSDNGIAAVRVRGNTGCDSVCVCGCAAVIRFLHAFIAGFVCSVQQVLRLS